MLNKKEIYEMACEILIEQCREAKVIENYVGRGMYGTTCIAIETSATGVEVGWAIGFALNEENELENSTTEILPARVDPMGHSYIYY